MNLTTARIFPHPLDFRLALCHRFAAIASAKSCPMSTAVNGLSTMFGDHGGMSPKSAKLLWDNDFCEERAALWGGCPKGACVSDHHQ
ncbi:MAG: hypothetical protein EOS36_14095 [Mesorhizobium sp.]|uniref:hypothetical protein n=1 Tax=Mesorhizobium sp. TaxID=1871066 RepID=UPI000FE85383|nr:hypothetical protein [Mesorhizobium sp.]RWD62860.1 MAG: hypothetical protein EOS36_14095 [Mesorhizobium sp.]RWE43428.1 MAG: hypothetical protein EOS79_15310 [Mesorhizobium sp.]